MSKYKKKQINVDTVITGMGLEPIPWWGHCIPQEKGPFNHINTDTTYMNMTSDSIELPEEVLNPFK